LVVPGGWGRRGSARPVGRFGLLSGSVGLLAGHANVGAISAGPLAGVFVVRRHSREGGVGVGRPALLPSWPRSGGPLGSAVAGGVGGFVPPGLGLFVALVAVFSLTGVWLGRRLRSAPDRSPPSAFVLLLERPG